MTEVAQPATSSCADLIVFADGEMEKDRAESFRQHLEGCEKCGGELVDVLALTAQFSQIDPTATTEADKLAAGVTTGAITPTDISADQLAVLAEAVAFRGTLLDRGRDELHAQGLDLEAERAESQRLRTYADELVERLRDASNRLLEAHAGELGRLLAGHAVSEALGSPLGDRATAAKKLNALITEAARICEGDKKAMFTLLLGTIAALAVYTERPLELLGVAIEAINAARTAINQMSGGGPPS